MCGRLGQSLDTQYMRSVFSPKRAFHLLINEAIGVGNKGIGRGYRSFTCIFKCMHIFSLLVQIYAREVCNRETGMGNSKYTEPMAGCCMGFIPWGKDENYGNFPQNVVMAPQTDF